MINYRIGKMKINSFIISVNSVLMPSVHHSFTLDKWVITSET